MTKKTNNLQVRVDDNYMNWFDILETKYRIKRADFIRQAIIEKFQRDTPKLRLKLIEEKTKLPF